MQTDREGGVGRADRGRGKERAKSKQCNKNQTSKSSKIKPKPSLMVLQMSVLNSQIEELKPKV